MFLNISDVRFLATTPHLVLLLDQIYTQYGCDSEGGKSAEIKKVKSLFTEQ